MADREEVGIDQETFDKATAEGKPERVARALAKSAYVRKTRGPAAPGTPKAAPAEGAPAETPAAAPACSGVPLADLDDGVPRRLLDVQGRTVPRAGEPEPHAEPVESAVVLPRAAGAPALLPPAGRRRDDPRPRVVRLDGRSVRRQ